ncbi:hypothetical protein [Amycolatopsis sp. NPDC051372]|uniref:hypothetical protein n=1 Tax=Amycolatopsis sp. NPDC051372 TaxID=3155669 RepID=UPI00341CB209
MEWYAVRCVFQWNSWRGSPFEERITLWRASSLASAIELGEREAGRYASENGVTYVDFAQAYALRESGELSPGAEVFSLLRDSPLPPEEYVTRFYDTGGNIRGLSTRGIEGSAQLAHVEGCGSNVAVTRSG